MVTLWLCKFFFKMYINRESKYITVYIYDCNRYIERVAFPQTLFRDYIMYIGGITMRLIAIWTGEQVSRANLLKKKGLRQLDFYKAVLVMFAAVD